MKKFVSVKPKLKVLLPSHMRVIDKFSMRAPHFIYGPQSLSEVKETEKQPKTLMDKVAKKAIKGIRWLFDKATFYSIDNMTEEKWINRCIFLETVAGVPGMVAGMGRHLRSLRFLERDKGRIHHLLEEADNERFHLFIFLNLKKPGILFRTYIIVAQTMFFASFMASYLISPRFCHRFVGYLEEEAVHTYTEMLRQIEEGCLQHWNELQAPSDVSKYYSLPHTATYRDVVLAVRADEACHREVNHFFSDTNEFTQIEYQETHIQEHVQHTILQEFRELSEARKKESKERQSGKKSE